MALLRIRHQNQQFSNAQLVGATIRVRTNSGAAMNPLLNGMPRIDSLLNPNGGGVD